MSTHAVIAYQHSDDRIVASWCYADNYLDGTGRQLLRTFNTPDKALELAKHGYMSIISGCRDIEEIDEETNPSSVGDDGEPRYYDNFEEFRQSDHVASADYVYLYTPDGWTVSHGFSPYLTLAPLEQTLLLNGVQIT